MENNLLNVLENISKYFKCNLIGMARQTHLGAHRKINISFVPVTKVDHLVLSDEKGPGR